MGDGFVCSVDKIISASVLCVCTDPPTLLCNEHREKHLAQPLMTMGSFHSMTSVSAIQEMKSKEDIRRMKSKLMKINEKQTNVKENLIFLQAIQAQFSCAFDATFDTLNEKKKSFERHLAECYEFAKLEIDTAAENSSMHAFDLAFVAKTEFERMMIDFDSHDDQFFSYAIETCPENWAEMINVSFMSRIQSFQRFNIPKSHVIQMDLKQAQEQISALQAEISKLKKQFKQSKIRIERDFEIFKKTSKETEEQLKKNVNTLKNELLAALVDIKEKERKQDALSFDLTRLMNEKQTFFLQNSLSVVNSVLEALYSLGRTALPALMQYIKQAGLMESRSEVLVALTVGDRQKDVNREDFSMRKELVGVMKQKFEEQLVLPLDVFNAISTDLIKFTELLKTEGAPLVVEYRNRKQLVADLKVSDLLKDASPVDIFQHNNILRVSNEFVVSLTWDESPNNPMIFRVFSKLLSEMTAPNSTGRAVVVSLVLSKSTLSVAVVPMKNESSQLMVITNGASIKMSVEDVIRMAIMWELKPDLLFLASKSGLSLPRISSEHATRLETLAKAMAHIQVKVELPYLEISEPQEVKPQLAEEKPSEKIEEEKNTAEEQFDSEEELYAAGPPRPSDEDSLFPNINPKMKFMLEDLEDSPPVSSERKRPSLTWKCASCKRDIAENLSFCPHCKPAKEENQFTLGRKPATAPITKPANELLTATTQQKEQRATSRWTCSCGVPNNPAQDRCISCRKAKGSDSAQTKTPDKKWTCPQCGDDNDESSSQCVFCQAQRKEGSSAEKKSGEWICTHCYTVNAEKRIFCSQCQEMKPTIAAKEAFTVKPDPPKATQSPNKPAQPGRVDLKPVESKQGYAKQVEKWSCPSCKKTNTGLSQTCLWCNSPKEQHSPGKQQQAKALSEKNSPQQVNVCEQCGNALGQNEVSCQKCRIVPSSNSGVWTCKKCKAVNLDNSVQCKQCAKKRADEAPHEEENWKCQFCGNPDNFEDEDKCYKCGKKRNALVTPPASWTCAGCGFSNSERDVKCYQCRRSKVPDPPATDLLWTCGKCQTKNRAGVSSCSNCYQKKTKDIILNEDHPGGIEPKSKWCECGNKLTGDLKRCATCEAKQIGILSRPDPGIWKCKYCSVDNRASVDKCSGCQMKKLYTVPSKQPKRCAECSNTIYRDEPLCPTCKKKAEATKPWRCSLCKTVISTPGRCRQCSYRS